MAYKFSFNLLPAKDKKEVEKEEKKFSSLFYSIVLLLFAVFVWVAVLVVDLVFVNSKYKQRISENTQLDKEISSYWLYSAKNGELVTKTNMLSSVILKHKDPSLVFDTIDGQIKQSVPDATILRYGRSQTGNYQVTAEISDIFKVIKLVKDFNSNPNVQDASLLSLSKLDNGSYLFILDLEILENNQNE